MEKKTVIVTGGTKGIGLAISQAFLKAGYDVYGASRKNDGALKDIKFKELDVTNRKAVHKLVQDVVKETGRLDAFINCAGVSIWKPLDQIDEEFWSKIIDTNAAGTFWGCQAASHVMKSGGVIINISSLAGKRGSSNNSVYCASKFAVNGITQSLAKELGPRGIRVNAVCPVYVETPMILESLKDPLSPSGGQEVGSYLKKFAADNAALKRLPLATEVAQSCLYLASEQASAITGQCINVDCGVLPQ